MPPLFPGYSNTLSKENTIPLNGMKCRTPNLQRSPISFQMVKVCSLKFCPAVKKIWRLKYRIFNKEKRIALGLYPGVGLLQARVEKDKLKQDIKAGHTPALVRLEQRQLAHVKRGSTDRAYDRAEYLNQRITMMQAMQTILILNFDD